MHPKTPIKFSIKKLKSAILTQAGSDLSAEKFLGKRNLDPPKFFKPRGSRDFEGKKMPKVNYNTGFERRVHDIFKNS